MRTFTSLLSLICLTPLAFAGMKVSVEGDGYLRFAHDGKILCAKSADLVSLEGSLGLANGAKLVPTIRAASLNGVQIDLEGHVTLNGQRIGRLVLALFKQAQDDSGALFSATERPTLGNPGEGTNGVVRTDVAVVVHKSATEKLPVKKQDNAVKASLSETVGGKASVTLSDRCEVEGDTITLGSISTIKASPSLAEKLGGIVLGDTPNLPIERVIDRTRLLAKIKLAGIDPDTLALIGPEKIKVTRKGQKVTHEQFVESALSGAKIKGYGGTLENTLPGPDVTVPLGELQLVCESVSGSNLDLNAVVGIYVDGKRFNSRSVKLRSTFSAPSVKIGTIVTVRVRSGAVFVDSKGKVTNYDQTTGLATVSISDTGAQLTGIINAEGIVEVKA